MIASNNRIFRNKRQQIRRHRPTRNFRILGRDALAQGESAYPDGVFIGGIMQWNYLWE